MAGKRDLKKDINSLLGDVIEECYSQLLEHPGIKEEDIEKIIDDAADLADDLIFRVNNIRHIEKKADVKKHFEKIKADLEDKSVEFIERLNKLSK